jgi:hypothetical protein
MDGAGCAQGPALTRPRRARPSPWTLVAGAVIAVALLVVWVDGARQWFVPCAADCGETFDAIQYAVKYRLYGFRYLLVQDMSTSAAPERFPLFYTHNVNVGGIGFAVLEALGVTPLWAKQLMTLLGFGAGLVYVFRATAYHTRSVMVGALVVSCFAADYHHVLSFGLNALRAWHWLAIFGLLFHVARYVRESASRARDRAAIVLLAGLSFGIGYDFWAVCLAMSLLMSVTAAPGRRFALGPWRIAGWIGVAFGLPVLLRQVQIAAVLGPAFWAADLYYSAVIKVSLLSRILPFPGMEEVERLYERFDVLRPPAGIARSVGDILEMLRYMIRWDLLPTLGAVAAVISLGVIGLGIVLTLVRRFAPPRALIHVLASIGLRGRNRRVIVGGSNLITALALGAAAGLAVFAPLSFHIYLKHQFPLVAGPVLIVKGFVLAWAVRELGRSGRRWIWRMGPVIVAGALAIDHAIVQAEDWKARPAVDMSWIGAIQSRTDSTFAVSWIPGTVAAFSRAWVVGVRPGAERLLLERLRTGRSPFVADDFFLMGRRDLAVHEALYQHPDYWLYFPTDRRDGAEALTACREDYLVRTLHRLLASPSAELPRATLKGLWPERVRPGGVVSIVGQVEPVGASVERVELVAAGGRTIRLGYDCHPRLFMGTYTVPLGERTEVLSHRVWITLADGHRFSGPLVQVTVDPGAEAASVPHLRASCTQPRVRDLLGRDPWLPVAEVGSGYVLFDLRPVREQHLLPRRAGTLPDSGTVAGCGHFGD